MQDELRNSGIDVIGSVPWGTHFCQFYQTKQDLIDILVPYFKAGLEDNEFCMWVTSEPLMTVEVQETMREAVEDFDDYLRNGQIEVISYQDWYLLGGTFDDDRVLRGWVSKLEQALARGFSGLRLTGNTFWLERNHWHAFMEYEAKVNDVIGRYRMLAICTYSLDKCDGAAVIDVVRNHQFALIKQEGRWDIIESAIYKQAKEALHQSEERYRSLFNNMTEAFALHEIVLDDQGKPCDYRFIEVNEAFTQHAGLLPQEIIGKTVREVLPGMADYWIETYGKVALTGEAISFESFSALLGKWCEVHAYSPKRGVFAALFKDITERKRMEEVLRESEQDLNRAQAVAQTGSWRLDVRRNQLLWSDETHRIFGIPKGTPMTYETFLSSVHPEDREYVDRKWTAALRGEPYDIEHRIIVGNGIRWVREKAELEFDGQGLLKGGFGTAQDITERKKAELERERLAKELSDSLTELQIVLDTVPVAVWIARDPDCRTITGNIYANQLIGVQQGNNISQSAPPSEATITFRALHNSVELKPEELPAQVAAATGKPVAPQELELIFDDGHRLHILIGAVPLFDTEGHIRGAVAAGADITELKRLENELRVQDYAIASAISGIAMADLEGRVIYANPTCLSMWDYEEEEVLGKHVTAFFADVTEAEAALKAILEEEAWQGEVKAKRRDGSAFDVQVSANLVTDADGTPVCMMASFVDITDMKIIQEALKREEQIRRTIMENTGTQLAYLDSEFNFVMVNSAYAKGSGHTKEELIGKNHFALFPSGENRAIFEQVRDTGKSVVYFDKPFEFIDQSERGVTYWDWTLIPVKDFSGKVQGLVLSLIETTERKKVEELKDSFIGMVSHELRTPLTVLIGSLHTAMIPGMAEEEKHGLVEDALWEASALSRLLENLLELSRHQAKRLELMKEPVAIDRCVQNVVDNLSRMSPFHKLVMEIPSGLPLTEVDQIRVERILYNLIENAIKYSPGGGDIRVSAVRSEDQIVVAVSDQGPGIPQEGLSNLFRRFERLTESSANSIRGMGLGLYVCRLLVEAHGGRIWAESEPGKGSTFYFTLPVSSQSR
jgi:PAS domain S-box-containing protein